MVDARLTGADVALVFPGQGSQFVGMGHALYDTSAAARGIFDQADRQLGFALSGLCFDGPADDLNDTINAQPAILTMSVAALAAIEETSDQPLTPIMVAGHSLGEFTALIAAGVLDFSETLGLVRERGILMKEAGNARPGGMAAVIGLDDDSLVDVVNAAGSAGIVRIANANCPGQTVISGEVDALLRAMELAKAKGAKRVARLSISIASHSPLMEQASAKLNDAIDQLTLQAPRIPIVANTTGLALTSADEVREELRHHVERPVNWTRTVMEMVSAGVTTFAEIGPGNVLSGLIKRIDRTVTTLGLGDLGLPADERRATAPA